MLKQFVLISFTMPDVRKTLNKICVLLLQVYLNLERVAYALKLQGGKITIAKY